VGARKRSEAEDEPLIHKLVDAVMDKYPQLRVVSTSCDRGIGKIVKNKCLPLGEKNPDATFKFVEAAVRIYLPRGEEFTKSEFANIFIARNAMLCELGDEFHLFVEYEPRGMMADLLHRVKARGAPYALYKLGEKEVKEAKVVW
jgi:hypothetical protein